MNNDAYNCNDFSNLASVLRFNALEHSNEVAYIFLDNNGEEKEVFTYSRLHSCAELVSIHLKKYSKPGERVLLLFASDEYFLISFFSCLYAGLISVPAYPPTSKSKSNRIYEISEDSQARVILTTTKHLQQKNKLSEECESLKTATWFSIEEILNSPPLPTNNIFQATSSIPNTDIAYLQYTSGSTGTSKGVVVTNSNLLHQSKYFCSSYNLSSKDIYVAWLPFFHDLGLIGVVIVSLYMRIKCVLIQPHNFVINPFRWLETITKYKGTITAAPNFAFDLCMQRINNNRLQSLDLSSLRVVINAAEPIHLETLQSFSKYFNSCGFEDHMWCPSYGLAEATLIVTAINQHETDELIYLTYDHKSLNKGELSEHAYKNSITFVSVGQPIPEHKIIVVDPSNLMICNEGNIGEILVSGPCVTAGYWQNTLKTNEIFVSIGKGDEKFLRTGDQGFIKDNNIYFTSRLKDLIILNGQNYLPHDLEKSVQISSSDFTPNGTAAFTVQTTDRKKMVVIVQEINSHPKNSFDSLVQLIQSALTNEQDIFDIYSIILIKRYTLPKTSSGKVQRKKCKNLFIENKLRSISRWDNNAFDLDENNYEIADK